MPTFNIIINVDSKKANTAVGSVNRGLKTAETAAVKTRQSVEQLTRAQERQGLAVAKVIQRMVREEERARARMIAAAERQGLAAAKANKRAADAAIRAAQREEAARERASLAAARAIRSLEREQERAAAKAGRDQVRKIAKQQEEWNKQMVVGAAALYALQQAGTIIAELSDEYQGIENRLRQVTAGQGGLSRAMETTFDIAQRTRTEWQVTAELYTRIRRATAEYGYTTQDAARSTETLNKIVQMSGANLEESRAALYQFSQALASNRLGGDEFRSVLEQMPDIIRVIAKHMGVTVGEMKALAKQGKITAQVMMDSLAEAAEETDKKFAKMTPTISQSLTVLRNAIVKGVGEFVKSSGIAKTFANAVAFVRDNIDDIIPILAALAKVIGVFLAQRAIVGAIAAFQRLRVAMVAMAATPMGWVTILAAGIVALSSAIPELSDALGELAKKGGEIYGGIFKLGQNMRGGLQDIGKDLFGGGGPNDLEKMETTIETLLQRRATARADALNSGKITKDQWLAAVIAEREGQQKWMANKSSGGLMDMIAANKEYIDVLSGEDEALAAVLAQQEAVNQANAEFDKNLKSLTENLFPIKKAQQDLFDNTMLLVQAFAQGKIGAIEWAAALERLQETTADARNPAQSLYDSILRRTELARMPSGKRELAQTMDQMEAQLVGAGKSKTEAWAIVKNMEPEIKAMLKAEKAANGSAKAHDKLKKELEDLSKAFYELERSVFPLQAAWHDLREAQEITDKAIAKGIITMERGEKVMERYRQLHEDALDPIGALHRELDEQISQLGMHEDALEAYNMHQELSNKIMETGIVLSEAENKALHEKIDLIRELQRQKEIGSTLPLAPATGQFANPDDALGFAKIGQIFEEDQKYSQAQSYAKNHPFKMAVAEMTQEMLAINEPLEIMKIGLKGLEDALVELATTGKISFKSLIDAMLADLARLAAQQLIANLLGLALGGSGGTAFGALSTLAAGNKSGNIAGKHSTGGSWLVGGGGGVDSQMVAFRASPWERVTVTQPGQSAPDQHGRGSGGGMPTTLSVRIVNQQERSAFRDYVDSPQGERQLLNVMGRRRGAAGGMMR